MTLTAWCFTNASNSAKTPNKTLSFTLVVVGLGLEIWAGLSKEEFFLVGMPFSIGTGLVLGSVLVSPRRSVRSVSETELSSTPSRKSERRSRLRNALEDHNSLSPIVSTAQERRQYQVLTLCSIAGLALERSYTRYTIHARTWTGALQHKV